MSNEAVETVESGIGAIQISNEVIKTLAGMAAKEVKGIAGMSGSTWDDIVELIGRKDLGRGVEVHQVEGEGSNAIALDMDVVVDYGINLPEVAGRLQQAVKAKIEAIAGKTVKNVNIRVVGLRLKDLEGEAAGKKSAG